MANPLVGYGSFFEFGSDKKNPSNLGYVIEIMTKIPTLCLVEL